MSLQLKMQLLYLCTQAARDSDPEPFAAIICNDVPREALDALINDPNWIDALSKFHPAVKQHADWFNELRDAVTDELIERDRPDLPDPENDAISTESENGEANFVPESDDGINRNT